MWIKRRFFDGRVAFLLKLIVGLELGPLLRQLGFPSNLSLQRIGAWTLSNLVEGQFQQPPGGASKDKLMSGKGDYSSSDEIDIRKLLPTLRRLLGSADAEVPGRPGCGGAGQNTHTDSQTLTTPQKPREAQTQDSAEKDTNPDKTKAETETKPERSQPPQMHDVNSGPQP